MVDDILSMEKEAINSLSQRYDNSERIGERLKELRGSDGEDGKFYRENWKLVLCLIDAPHGIRGARILKNRFIKKLHNLGADIANLERDFYYVNSKLIWLKSNAMTPTTRRYWNGWTPSDYNKYGKNCCLVLLCGNEEVTIILPPDVHTRWFIHKAVVRRQNGRSYYSTLVTPRETYLEYKVEHSTVENANKYINNFKSLGFDEKKPMPTDTIIRAQFLSSTILSYAKGFSATKPTSPKTSTVMESDTNLLSSMKEKILEIRSFVNGASAEQPSNEKLCFWLWLCYEFGFYKEGAILFRKVDEDSVSQDLYKIIKEIGLACERRCDIT